MNKFIGIDNGSTGSIAILNNGIMEVFDMPVIETLNYQKTAEKYINRLDYRKLMVWIVERIAIGSEDVKILIERPMINSFRFDASVSAARCLEATLITLDMLSLGFMYCDSKMWQKHFLPFRANPSTGIKDPKEKARISAKFIKEGKEIAFQRAKQMYPNIPNLSVKNCDSVLIAEFCRLYWSENSTDKQ